MDDLDVDGRIILTNLRVMGYEGEDWIHLAQDMGQ
jgi:hypothetical protein